MKKTHTSTPNQVLSSTPGKSLNAKCRLVSHNRRVWLICLLASLAAVFAQAQDRVALATSIRHDGTNVELRLTTPPGPRYRVETSSDLKAWQALGITHPTATGILTAPDPLMSLSYRFYRVAVPRAEILVPLVSPNLPEGLVMDEQGNAYLSMVLTGEIRKIAPDGTQSKFAQVPSMVAGLAIGPSNDIYAAVAPQPADPSQHGIWRIQPDGTASIFAILPPDSMPNGVVFDAQGRLFATDSIGGRIFRIDGVGAANVWTQSPLLVGAPNPAPPHPAFPIGANGLAFVGANAFVCNTDLGTLVRIPINDDGSAGTPEVFVGGALLGGADGLRADASGNLYVANVIQSLIVRVAPERAIQVIADNTDGLDSPSSLCFGNLPGQRTRLFAVNYATISASIPGANPKPGLLRIDTEVIKTMAVFPPPNLPEGLVMDEQGNAYLSMVLTGEIRKIAPDGTQSKFAQVPSMVAGLAIGPSNDIYAAVAPQPADPSQHGIWRIQPDGTASIFAILPPDTMPNDVVFDAQGRLFATDSIGGRVFRIDDAGVSSIWIQSPLLVGAPNPQPPHPPFPIGANGLAFVGTNAFVCNTDMGILVRIPVNPDAIAGTPEVFIGGALLGGADGLRADASGNLYVANVIQSLIVRVRPDRAMEVIADGLDGLDSPSSLCFGTSPSQGDHLYLVNYATISASIPGANPKPAFLKLDLRSAVSLSAPQIKVPPQSQSVTVGQNVDFVVEATGTSPLWYQWRFNGTDIAGATNASLRLDSVAYSHGGNYTVIVSNIAGSVTSQAAVLSVKEPIAPIFLDALQWIWI
jgi:sugar lactone lactonase YvrE